MRPIPSPLAAISSTNKSRLMPVLASRERQENRLLFLLSATYTSIAREPYVAAQRQPSGALQSRAQSRIAGLSSSPSSWRTPNRAAPLRPHSDLPFSAARRRFGGRHVRRRPRASDALSP